jgi:hypothetical protein
VCFVQFGCYDCIYPYYRDKEVVGVFIAFFVRRFNCIYTTLLDDVRVSATSVRK